MLSEYRTEIYRVPDIRLPRCPKEKTEEFLLRDYTDKYFFPASFAASPKLQREKISIKEWLSAAADGILYFPPATGEVTMYITG